MNKLKKEIEEEMEENNIDPDDMLTDHYYIFGGILNEFDFKKE
ncbi:MAG: hypothetical protein ACW97X_12365 [Candidatus Hodarchaeales archaeon]|jgi:hypothetical protein